MYFGIGMRMIEKLRILIDWFYYTQITEIPHRLKGKWVWVYGGCEGSEWKRKRIERIYKGYGVRVILSPLCVVQKER